MKKFIVVLLLGLLILGLLPLGVGSDVQAQDGVTITMVHLFADPQDFRSQVVEDIAAEFTAETGVTVNIITNETEYGPMFNAALLAYEQGNQPTIVQVDESLTQLAIDSEAFVAIEDVASPEQLAELDDVLPVIREFFSLGDKTWSVPWNNSNPILFYNKNHYIAAGLDPDVPPTTFDEVLAHCEAIMAAEIETVSHCANWPLTSWFIEQWLAMLGEPLLNNDNGRSARASEIYLGTESVRLIFDWWAEMAERGFYTYTGSPGDYNGDAINFLGQNTAIHINSTAGITLLQNFSRLQGFELGIAPLIRPNEDANGGVTVGGASLFIMKGFSEAETQAAADFIFYLVSTENMARWHQGSGYLPNRQSAIDLLIAEGWYEEHPEFYIALNQLLNSDSTVANAGMVLGPAETVRGMIGEAVQSIIDGGQDVEESLMAAKVRIDRELAQYNLLFD